MNWGMGLQVSPASSYFVNSGNWLFEDGAVAKWTPEENKRFENALAVFDKDTPDRWDNVAKLIPGKTAGDVMRQYRELVEDVSDIEAGLIPIPGYTAGNSFTLDWVTGHGCDGLNLKQLYGAGKRSAAARCADHERKKGVPWTEEEHKKFLLGLKKYGKGDWRNISRNFVTTRTPTQVASHAQKYFIRQLSGGKDKRRSSIHDITTVNLDETKSPSPDKDSPGSPRKSNNLIGQSLEDSREMYDCNMLNFPGSPMGFSPPDACLMISHLQGLSSVGLNLLDNRAQGIDPNALRLGHYGTGFSDASYPT